MASSPKIDDLKKKFEENPRRYFAPLANEYRKVGEIEQAIAICKEYLPQQPGHMSGHIVFGQALFEAKQMDEAKTVFETALSLDPENLIALKHLGDIALKAGDIEGAKGWYKRVLEADPRNEEAQVQMRRLEGGEKVAGPTTVTPVVSLSSQPTQPVPTAKALAGASAPTVVMAAFKPGAKVEAKPTAPTPVSSPGVPAAPKAPATAAPAAATPPAPAPTAASPTAEIRLEGMTSMEPPGTKAGAGQAAPAQVEIIDSQSAPPATPVAPTVGLETTAIASAEAPAMESFTLEGLETTSMSPAAPPPVAPPPVAPPPVAPPPVAPAPAPIAEINLDFAPPAAQPAPTAPPPAPAPPAIDLDFAPPPAQAPPSPPPAAAPPVIEMDVPVPSAPAPMPEIALDLPSPAGGEPGLVDLNVDLPPVPPTPVAPVAPAPEPEPAAPAVAGFPPVDAQPPAEEPFVTETMAELYLHQGHRDEALRVYRALLAQKPGDAGLQAKIASLEAPPVPTTHADPTIRSILLLIAERRPGHRPGQNGSAPAVAVEDADEAPSPAPRSADATQGPPSRLSADALSLLWDHAPPQPAEETAAVMLAMAFADLVGMDASAPPAAAPAPAAAAGSVAPPSSFSFDKFFNQRVTSEHATQVPAAAPAESQEDVAKFTRWLEGLKQQ